jgi:hypothetical protein
MIQDNYYMWHHIFNINIAVIFEIFFFKNFSVGYFPSGSRKILEITGLKKTIKALDFVSHQPTRVQDEKLKK